MSQSAPQDEGIAEHFIAAAAPGNPGLRASEAQALWHVCLDALALVDDERRYLCVNPKAVELLGAPVDEVLRRRIEDFTPREQWPELISLWSKLEQRGSLAGNFEVLQRDGSRVPIEFRAQRDFRAGQHLICARPVAPRWARRAPARASEVQMPALTRRETEVLQLTAEGLAGPQIASLLCVSPSTVKTHLGRTYPKLGARDRASAVAIGLADPQAAAYQIQILMMGAIVSATAR